MSQVNLLHSAPDYKLTHTRFGVRRDWMNEAGVRYSDYRSHRQILGMPIVAMASGISPETGRKVTAVGFIAIGQRARGVVAIGQFSVGAIAIGQVAIGSFVAVGQFSVAPLCLGQLAVGLIGAGQVGIAAVGAFMSGVVGVGVTMAAAFKP